MFPRNLSKVFVFLFCLFVVNSSSVFAFDFFSDFQKQQESADKPVEAVADQLEYVKGENKIIGKGNVIVTYLDMRLTCDYAEVFTDTKKVLAKGHVVLYRKGDVLRGEEGEYDFTNNTGHFPGGSFQNYPYYGSGTSMDQISKDKFIVENAVITTCDHVGKVGEPVHYDIKAKKVIVYPNEKIIASNVYLRILDKPVFWLPYIHVPLRDGHAPLHVQPGYSSEDGAYVLTKKRFAISEDIRGAVNVDYRAKRGWGGGVDLDYDFDLLGGGLIKTYIIDDDISPDQKVSNPYSHRVNKTRYRLTWKHKKKIDPHTTLVAEYNNFSDRYLLKDFFEREYEEETDPDTFVTLTHNRDNYGIFFNFEKRINHFVGTIEKLPEIRFNWNNQEIGNSGVFFKNETSFASFHEKFAQSDIDNDVSRFDTFHEVSLPKKIDIFSVKPYMNWRGDWYNKNISGEDNLTRQVVGGGIDINTKFYRIFDIQTNLMNMNINKLRHVLEPNFKYEFVRHRSVLPSELTQIDAIDAIDDKDVIRFGFDNRLQTKRGSGDGQRTVNLVSFNTYLTYAFNTSTTLVNELVEDGSSYVTWDNEVEFRPYPWLLAKGDFAYDFPNKEFSEANLDLEVSKQGLWHAYLQQKFLKTGSKQITLDGSYKINDMWGIGGYIRTEFDEGDLTEEWEIRASRDLHCWFLDFGYNVRNSDIDSSNKEVFVELTLKAFPEYPLKAGNHSSYSRARIGDTVSGANNRVLSDESYEEIRY